METEKQFYDHIFDDKLEKIIVLVSHRFSTIRKADYILVLDNGCCIEQGSHDYLMQKNGLYGSLFSMQAQGYLSEDWYKNCN